MKTLKLIECRACGGTFYAGDYDIKITAGTENKFPDELYIVVRKISRCLSCKQHEDRTYGAKKKRYER